MLSCASEDGSNQSLQVNADLTGTWITASVEESFDNATGQHAVNTVYSTVYIAESDADIQMSGCEYYSDPVVAPFVLLRDSDVLRYLGDAYTPYLIVSPNELSRTFVESSGSLITTYKQTLSRTSAAIRLSRGSLVLDGPISASNQDHVCLEQRSGAGPSSGSVLHIIIPFDNDILNLHIDITGPVSVGDYQYSRAIGNSNALEYLNVHSNSAVFRSQLGTNGLFPDAASLSITVSQPALIEGEFSFTGIDGGDYTGSFSVAPY